MVEHFWLIQEGFFIIQNLWRNWRTYSASRRRWKMSSLLKKDFSSSGASGRFSLLLEEGWKISGLLKKGFSSSSICGANGGLALPLEGLTLWSHSRGNFYHLTSLEDRDDTLSPSRRRIEMFILFKRIFFLLWCLLIKWRSPLAIRDRRGKLMVSFVKGCSFSITS